MSLNPLKFAQEVNQQYLRFQLTEHRLTDPTLGKQLKDLLWRPDSPLIKGPYVSISRAFEEGRSVADLVKDKLLHPKMQAIIPYETVYKHQEETLRAVQEGKDVLITTGTGSGKTESFLYPIINRILRARDHGHAKGVMALIVYPMNALATDQLERFRDLLVGTGITFGMYTGETPNERSDAQYAIKDVPAGTTRVAYEKLLQESSKTENQVLHPNEERYTRKHIQEDPPRILLTNTRMLEYLLSRAEDLKFLREAPLEFLVMDEAHTNSGALGAEVALLLRRVKAIVQDKAKIQHIAASATIVDKKTAKAGQRFLARLMGSDPERVQIVWESYQDLKWGDKPLRGQIPRQPEALFERTLKALDLEGPQRITELEAIYRELTNHDLPPGAPIEKRLEQGFSSSIEQRLHDGFLLIDFARAIYETGAIVGDLEERIQDAWTATGRGPIRDRKEARWEYLTYLALGAAAVKDDTPILRPKLHFFVKGLEDAVVVFNKETTGDRTYVPELFLSRERALDKHPTLQATAMFPIKSCPRCGQHHYEQYVDVEGLEDKQSIQGGTVVEGGAVFHPDGTTSKTRILFTDRVLQDSGEYDSDGTKHHAPGAVCRFCGALHSGSPKRCGSCENPNNHELVPVQILDSANKVSTCPVCGYGAGYNPGGRADPFRALSENTARNVYVLAQDMLALADKKSRKLILFTDNRQDAAFQAGSMRDNSRVFRLRQLIQSYLLTAEDVQGGKDASVEALVDRLAGDLWKDEALARFVAPEVFEATLESTVSTKRQKELKRFLSIQVLNELARPYTDRKALEALGRLQVHYTGIAKDSDGVQDLAHQHGLKPSDVALWLEAFLHQARRRTYFTHDLVPELFAQSWDNKRNDLVSLRYVPESDFRPGGLVIEKEAEHRDSKASLQALIGRNAAVEEWAKVGLELMEPDKRHEFLRDAWSFLIEAKALRRLNQLKWGNGRPIAGTSNVYHVNGQAMALLANAQRYECKLCKRLHGHMTPREACTAYRCGGQLVKVQDEVEPRDYDLVLLGRKRELDSFVMAEEHTAQVPKARRQEIERRFKKGQGVNTLVATPTLELGVDIGPLDMVLMRNVPPTSANYWQRSGRAGRRNRMATIYAYARNNAHDLHYYSKPTALLAGSISPPRFNLRNPVMVRKHVHAALLTHYQEQLRSGKAEWVANVFPKRVGDALFAAGRLRDSIDDVVAPLRASIQGNQDSLLAMVRRTFQENWPDDPAAVADGTLQSIIQGAPEQLLAAYKRVWNRLRWAQLQISAVAAREASGTPPSDEEARFQARCRGLLRAFNPNVWDAKEKGIRTDASYTLKVLANEGYLPGYATTSESVTATAHQAYSPGWERFEFELNRNTTVAIREHIPGNRIYANGGKYRVTNYIFPADEEVRTPIDWMVHPVTRAIKNRAEIAGDENVAEWIPLRSVPLVDSSLQYISHVEAQETTRYRIACHISGVIRSTHGGGTQYVAEGGPVEHRRGQEITLVNIGAMRKLEEMMGFPICMECGAVRSPHETDQGIDHFLQFHEKLHGKKPELLALHAKATVDGLLFKGLADATHAASFAEALRLAASNLLEMERDDLDWFMQTGSDDEVDLFLYDAMPGGSGLLHQMTDNWPQLVKTARELLQECPGACATSCYHCLRTYYNQFWHDELDRKVALDVLGQYATLASPSPLTAQRPQGMTPQEETNKWEKMLQHVVHNDWGLQEFQPQGRIQLGPTCSIPHTKPDMMHEKSKVAIYLDGSPHFEIQVMRRDQTIRHELEDMGWLVIELPIGDLGNDVLMSRIKERIGRRLAKTVAT